MTTSRATTSPATTPTVPRHRIVLAAAAAGVLVLAGCGSADTGPAAGAAAETCAPEDITLIGQVRNETNPYEKSWLDGGQEFAASVQLEERRLTYSSESPRQQEQIRQELSTGDTACMVLNVLPNSDADTTPIVRAAQEAGAYVVTQWNKPQDMHPWDYDRWIAHITYDGVESGYQIAKALFAGMGGQGGIVALQGVLSTAAAQDRFAGLEKALAETPGITLLDQQAADFDRTTAFNTTRTLLTKHGDQLGGVWAANDDMALGALRALEAAGRAGPVQVVGIDAVPEAVQAISAGTMTATVSSDGPWQGGIGLAMGHCALTGQLDVAGLPREQREFYATQFLVTPDNAAQFTAPAVDLSDFDCGNLFSRVDRPVSSG